MTGKLTAIVSSSIMGANYLLQKDWDAFLTSNDDYSRKRNAERGKRYSQPRPSSLCQTVRNNQPSASYWIYLFPSISRLSATRHLLSRISIPKKAPSNYIGWLLFKHLLRFRMIPNHLLHTQYIFVQHFSSLKSLRIVQDLSVFCASYHRRIVK